MANGKTIEVERFERFMFHPANSEKVIAESRYEESENQYHMWQQQQALSSMTEIDFQGSMADGDSCSGAGNTASLHGGCQMSKQTPNFDRMYNSAQGMSVHEKSEAEMVQLLIENPCEPAALEQQSMVEMQTLAKKNSGLNSKSVELIGADLKPR